MISEINSMGNAAAVGPILDLDQVHAFVSARHLEVLGRGEDPFLAPYPEKIATTARSMATTYYDRRYRNLDADGLPAPSPAEDLAEHAPDMVDVATCAGLFVYSMDAYGLRYEQVAQLSHHAVAEVVAGLAADNTLKHSRRHRMLLAKLDAAHPLSRVVKIAEIIHVARGLPGWLCAFVEDSDTCRPSWFDFFHWIDLGRDTVRHSTDLAARGLGPELEAAATTLVRLMQLGRLRRAANRQRRRHAAAPPSHTAVPFLS